MTKEKQLSEKVRREQGETKLSGVLGNKEQVLLRYKIKEDLRKMKREVTCYGKGEMQRKYEKRGSTSKCARCQRTLV